jgi:hypothetical protein
VQLPDLCFPVVSLGQLGTAEDAVGEEVDLAQSDRVEVYDSGVLLLLHGEYLVSFLWIMLRIGNSHYGIRASWQLFRSHSRPPSDQVSRCTLLLSAAPLISTNSRIHRPMDAQLPAPPRDRSCAGNDDQRAHAGILAFLLDSVSRHVRSRRCEALTVLCDSWIIRKYRFRL